MKFKKIYETSYTEARNTGNAIKSFDYWCCNLYGKFSDSNSFVKKYYNALPYTTTASIRRKETTWKKIVVQKTRIIILAPETLNTTNPYT